MFLSIKMGSGEGLEKDSRYDGVEKYYAYYEKKEIEQNLTSTLLK